MHTIFVQKEGIFSFLLFVAMFYTINSIQTFYILMFKAIAAVELYIKNKN